MKRGWGEITAQKKNSPKHYGMKLFQNNEISLEDVLLMREEYKELIGSKEIHEILR